MCLVVPRGTKAPASEYNPWAQRYMQYTEVGLTFCRGRRLRSSSASSISSNTCSWLFHLLEAVASLPTRAGSTLGLGFRAGFSRPNTTRSHSFSHLRRQRLVNCGKGGIAWEDHQCQGLPVCPSCYPRIHTGMLRLSNK